MKNAFVICGLILTGVVAVARTEEPTVTKRFFIISHYVIEIDGEDNGTIEVRGSELSFRSGLTLLTGDQRLKVGDLTLSLGPAGELLGNGTPDFQPENGFRVISAPQMVIVEGGEGTLRMATVSGFQYMERQPDGGFRLQTVSPESETGMKMRLVVRPPGEIQERSDQVDLEYEVKTTYMVGRERIPDVNLEIGKPVFETQKVENRLRVPMNTWMLLHSIKAKDVSDGSPTQLVVMMKIAERKR